MIITLENIQVLLDILVISKTVATPFKACESVTAMLSRLLEVSMIDANEEIRNRPVLIVSLGWFKDWFSVPKKGVEKPYGKEILIDYTSDKPCVMKWHRKKEERLYKKETRLLSNHLVSFRRRSNKFISYEMIWDTTLKGALPVHDIAFYHGPMKFVDIVEPDNPITVLRQMGHVQCILRDPYLPLDNRSRLAHRQALDVALRFRCTQKINLTVDDVFERQIK
ncbi:hypothetical protein Scep_014369 [Stephania cephalantha]|uniref:Uncharacterized protein n=1 Tax=Stephania cephalantha TaxID=152367 RepID=A0AAP0J302_9MAGN